MEIFYILIITTLLYALVVYIVRSRSQIEAPFIPWLLFVIHHLLTIAYLVFSYKSSTDSVRYYRMSTNAETWGELYGTGTAFMNFMAWPFTKYIGLSYYATMYLYSFFGLVGIYLLYMATKENLKIQPKAIFGIGFIELVFCLPNLHFWSSSLGKGAVMILGIGLTFWGLSRFNRRYIHIIIGALLIYYIRPHILLAIAMGAVGGLFFTNTGMKNYVKWVLITTFLVVFYFISDQVVEFADTDNLNIFDGGTSALSHRVESLGRANSGVDINNYSLPMKLFTFWFRPLFVDSPSIVGFFSSFENLFYIYMFFFFIKEGIRSWSMWNGWFKICFFVFLFGSVALAQISGNLGLAMRQKAQMMPLFFIVFCKAVSYSRKNNPSGEVAIRRN